MIKVLSCFNFNNIYYELLVDKNSKVYIKRHGENKLMESSLSDKEIAIQVINKIADMKYCLCDSIKENNVGFNVYKNLFNQEYYISRIENGKEIACNYDEYKSLYDMYNRPVIYNYRVGNPLDIFEDFKFNMSSKKPDDDEPWGISSSPWENDEEMSSSDNPWEQADQKNTGVNPWEIEQQEGSDNSISWGWEHNGDNSDTLGKQDESKGIWNVPTYNPFESFSYSGESAIDKKAQMNSARRSTSTNKPKNNGGIKVVKILIGGAVITALIAVSTVMATRFGRVEIVEEEPTVNAEQILDEIDDDDFNAFIEGMRRDGSEEWEIEQVIEQYAQYHKIELPKKEDRAEEKRKDKLSEKTNRLIESINENGNLSEEEKELIINSFTNYFENNAHYYEDLESLCKTLRELKIEYRTDLSPTMERR